MPSPGMITALELPGGPGVRVDTAIFDGLRDPAVLRLAGREADRLGPRSQEAIARGRRALGEFRIEGITTTIPFHLELLDDPAFRPADYDVDYLERRSSG